MRHCGFPVEKELAWDAKDRKSCATPSRTVNYSHYQGNHVRNGKPTRLPPYSTSERRIRNAMGTVCWVVFRCFCFGLVCCARTDNALSEALSYEASDKALQSRPLRNFQAVGVVAGLTSGERNLQGIICRCKRQAFRVPEQLHLIDAMLQSRIARA